ncbi:MAG: hypothetical protein N3E49_05215 [Bacteroidia bacterium]|nr:hypothetical protein [Bacteroidia bacterium]
MIGLIFDAFIGLLAIFIGYATAVYPLKRRINTLRGLHRIAFWAWILRVGGAFFTYYFYLLYYGGGDVIHYIGDSISLAQSFSLRPWQTIEYLLYSTLHRSYTDYFNTSPEFLSFWVNNGISLTYTPDYASQTVGILTFPFALAALGSVNGVIALFSTYSFYGSFRFYLALHKIYPTSWEKTAIPILFLPSVLSWIALPFKESFALLFVLYGMRKLFLEQATILDKIGALVLLYFSYAVKPYILISLIPIFGLLTVQHVGEKFKSSIFSYILYLMTIPIVLGLTLYILSLAAEASRKYSFENILQQAYIVKLDLTRNESYYVETGGSVYDIGDFEPSIPGILSKFPIAFYTGLLRPFIWEAKKGAILLAALETTALLIITLYGLFRHGIGLVLKQIIAHKWSRLLMIFAIFFIFMMGLTSGNFGNLVRYRVPGVLFFYTVLFATYGKLATEATDSRRRE